MNIRCKAVKYELINKTKYKILNFILSLYQPNNEYKIIECQNKAISFYKSKDHFLFDSIYFVRCKEHDIKNYKNTTNLIRINEIEYNLSKILK